MKEILIYKAQKSTGSGNEHVESMIISINKEQPIFDMNRTIAEVNERFDHDAELIVNALINSLPQGTTDRVLAKLMMKKATSLVIPFEG